MCSGLCVQWNSILRLKGVHNWNELARWQTHNAMKQLELDSIIRTIGLACIMQIEFLRIFTTNFVNLVRAPFFADHKQNNCGCESALKCYESWHFCPQRWIPSAKKRSIWLYKNANKENQISCGFPPKIPSGLRKTKIRDINRHEINSICPFLP